MVHTTRTILLATHNILNFFAILSPSRFSFSLEERKKGESFTIAEPHSPSVLQLFYDLDTELTYSCLTGYKRKGFQEAQCFFYNDSARWFGPDLTCHPIDCGPPEEILNGEKQGERTTYRCQVGGKQARIGSFGTFIILYCVPAYMKVLTMARTSSDFFRAIQSPSVFNGVF